MGKSKIFENGVDILKHKVLKEVAKNIWEDHDPFRNFNDVAEHVLPKGEPPMTCCVYKDRAILGEKMRLSLGEYHGSKDTIQVVSIACDECPKSGHTITNLCRGCVAHDCREVCPMDAIGLDEHGYAHIDKTKCIECGKCKAACKYGAVANLIRPCEKKCPVGAIHMGPDGASEIDQEKCIVCGNCVYECPFGAVNDISGIERVIKNIKNKDGRKVYGIVAPAVATQFPDATLGQVYQGILELGFDEVVEVAMGADLTALEEANELYEKGFLTTSCCPSFVEYIKVQFPELTKYISHTPSPMALTGKAIKARDKDAVIVFIGPCIAKKYECKIEPSNMYIDRVLTFLELQALFDSRDIDLKTLPELDLNQGSSYARGFSQSGGVANAVKEAMRVLGHDDFELKPIAVSGPDEIKPILLKLKAGKCEYNLIEGMMCAGGCIRGNGTMVNKKNSPLSVKEYMDKANDKLEVK